MARHRIVLWLVLVVAAALFFRDLAIQLTPIQVPSAPWFFAWVYYAWLFSPVLFLGSIFQRDTSRKRRLLFIALGCLHLLLVLGLAFLALLSVIAARS